MRPPRMTQTPNTAWSKVDFPYPLAQIIARPLSAGTSYDPVHTFKDDLLTIGRYVSIRSDQAERADGYVAWDWHCSLWRRTWVVGRP